MAEDYTGAAGKPLVWFLELKSIVESDWTLGLGGNVVRRATGEKWMMPIE